MWIVHLRKHSSIRVQEGSVTHNIFVLAEFYGTYPFDLIELIVSRVYAPCAHLPLVVGYHAAAHILEVHLSLLHIIVIYKMWLWSPSRKPTLPQP